MKRTCCANYLPLFLVKTFVSFCFLLFMALPIKAEESPVPDGKPVGSDAEIIPGSEKACELRARGWRFGTYLDLGYTINWPGHLPILSVEHREE
jgi:hypothetical protein